MYSIGKASFFKQNSPLFRDSDYIEKDKKDGDLTPGKAKGRPPIIDDCNLAIIKEIILSHPSGTLFEYCDSFEEKTGIRISKSCMWDACNTLNLRRKKKVSTR